MVLFSGVADTRSLFILPYGSSHIRPDFKTVTQQKLLSSLNDTIRSWRVVLLNERKRITICCLHDKHTFKLTASTEDTVSADA